MTIPQETPPPPTHAGEIRCEDHDELNRLLGQAARCVENMDLRGANEILKKANDEASGLSPPRTPEVEM